MPCLPRQLCASVAARWHEDTAGPDEFTSSWLTRVGYYEAIEAALRLRAVGEMVDARDVVAQHPKGVGSTFYSVASRRPLIQAYRRNVAEPVRQIADVARTDPLHQMLAEAQVWSFWRRRTDWIRWVDDWYPNGDVQTVTPYLVEQIRMWRLEHLHLASVGARLPLCSLEDVVIVSRGRVTPKEAARALTRTLAGTTPTLELPITIDLRTPPLRRPLPDDGGRATAERFVREALAILGTQLDAAAVQDKLLAAVDVLRTQSGGS